MLLDHPIQDSAKSVAPKEKDPRFCLPSRVLWYFSFATSSHKFVTEHFGWILFFWFFGFFFSREDYLVLEKFLLRESLVSLYINILRFRTIFFSSGLVSVDIIARQ